MKHKPEISVLMSVYNETAESIITAVNSILVQTFSNFEFIIINDNPQNAKTAATLTTIAAGDRRVKIITNDCNRGLGFSLNKAVKEASAPIIARMDTEDTSVPERLGKQLTFMQANSQVDLLFTQWFDVNEVGKLTIRQPTKSDLKKLKKRFFIKSLLMHPTLAARKEVLTNNPYPEMSRPEDIVLWLKLMRCGYVFDVLEEPLYKYRVNQIDIDTKYLKIKAGSRNLIPHLVRESRFYYRNMYFWIYFIRIIFEFFVSRNPIVFKLSHSFFVNKWKVFFPNS